MYQRCFGFMTATFFLFSTCISCDSNTSSSSTEEKPVDTSIYKEKDFTALYKKIDILKSELKNGDLLVRADDDAVASMLTYFSTKDKTFSHCGLVFKEDSSYYIYHIMAGHENPSEELIRQPVDSFVEVKTKTALGIMRYDFDSAEIVKLHSIIQKQYAAKMKFDKEFNLESDDKRYCAELVYKAMEAATQNRIKIPVRTAQNIPKKIIKYARRDFTGMKYIAIDDLYLNPYCKEIDSCKYADYIK